MSKKRVITQVVDVDKLLEFFSLMVGLILSFGLMREKAEAAILRVKIKSLMPKINCLFCFLRR